MTDQQASKYFADEKKEAKSDAEDDAAMDGTRDGPPPGPLPGGEGPPVYASEAHDQPEAEGDEINFLRGSAAGNA
jgi:hypothetical protein